MDQISDQGSAHLDEEERQQAAESAHPGVMVIHEVVRAEGEEELARSSGGLAWSGFAAGLSIGFSFLVQAFLYAGLPEAPWRPMVASFGYSFGFLIVILGRQQLFTETTLTAMIPVLTNRNLPTLASMLRVWGLVLAFNLLGTFVIAGVIAIPELFQPPVEAALRELAAHTMDRDFFHIVVMGALAGWLVGLMVWLLPGAGPARPLIIILLTYAVALGQFAHVVAGSVEAAFRVYGGDAGPLDYLTRFLAPTLLGNVLGGTALAALLNHAPVAAEIDARTT